MRGLSYLDSLDLQLQCRVLVDDEHRVGVQLQAGEGPHVVDAVLDALLEGEGLARADDDGDDLAGLEDGLDADGQGEAGHLADVVVEEAGVGEDGVVGERLDPGAGREAGAGLVEGDVAVLADAGEEEVDAAGGLDLGLVGDALGLQVGRVAVEDVDVVGVDVYVGEEVLPHEGVVALGVVPRDPDVLVLEWCQVVDGEGIGDVTERHTMLKVMTFSNEIYQQHRQPPCLPTKQQLDLEHTSPALYL